jgi:hypothetical protein
VITRYTITPYIGTTAQTTRTVTGTPAATSTTITGLTNGTAYTFAVTATNAAGTGVASAASPAVTPVPPPAFVQQASARGAGVTSITATTPGTIKAGNRLVVMVGAKNTSTTATQSVVDSAGNSYVRLTQARAADQTEMTVWTAPINAGGGTRPTITATVNGTAALAIQVLEYSGVYAVSDTTVVDQFKTATGVTGASANNTVQSGATAATTAANQLAIGFYLDAGTNRTLTVGAGFTMRANNSPATNMQFYAEDQISAYGSTPNAGVGTGARTTWLMTTVVLKHP